MTKHPAPDPSRPPSARAPADQGLVAEVDALVEAWLAAAATATRRPSAERLAAVLRDPGGLEFTVGFVDRVIRPEDPATAARALRDLVSTAPKFLPWPQRMGLRVAASCSRVAPGLVIAAVRAAMRSLVGHLLVDATDARLGASIARLRRDGARLNLNLLGESVLGRDEADRRLEGTRRLLERDDVDYVSIKASALAPPHAPWGFDEAVADIATRLLPLYRFADRARAAGRSTFINLDMEEYRDLDLTIAVFTRLLDRDELLGLEAGIVLQAYLPDSMGAMERLQEWATARRARGGAPIKVRLVKGANLPMERVEAGLRGWPLATFASKRDTDANYLRLLGYALTPGRIDNVRLGVAGHNLFDLAYAWLLAGRRGVRDGVGFEMLLGMAEEQALAVRDTVGQLLLYVPVVHPADFDVAIAYLVRRLEEGASPENFLSAIVDMRAGDAMHRRERERFLESLRAVDDDAPATHRTQDRRVPADPAGVGLAGAPDTDPALHGNREWGRRILARAASSTLGERLVIEHTLTGVAAAEQILREAAGAGARWGTRPSTERAAVLRAAAAEVERRRAELIEVAASETGKTIDQADPEVSEAVDFLNYYARLAVDLDRVDGARPVPVAVTVVAPPWNFPIAIPAGGVAAALAAGSAVVLKPAAQARRCGSLVAQALWDAGVPRGVLQLAHAEEDDAGRALVSGALVDRVILTGAFETAELFRRFRPDLPLLAETSGKNAMVIAPSADLDLAVKDLVASAFGHAGQKCSAASLAILVGPVADSRRFRDQLVDAVTSLVVGPAVDPRTQVGPLIEPASGKLLRALTELGPGEGWLVRPRRLDGQGRLWSPGVRLGVRPGSEFHLTEFFGPVLGLMRAATLEEALTIQNRPAFGLTAGLHSLDRDEVAAWLNGVEAGNAYVNRTTVGAIVARQPFGGWKRSAVGPGAKAGGPNYLFGLTGWQSAPATVLAPPHPRAARLVAAARRIALPGAETVARGAGSDAAAWRDGFGVERDVAALDAEVNLLRYLPVPVTVRLEDDDHAALLRVAAAGLTAGSRVAVSTAAQLPRGVAAALAEAGIVVRVQDAHSWAETLATPQAPRRVRLIGGDAAGFAAASRGRCDVACFANRVVEAGRVELLTFLREQAVSMTAHRFGSPTALAEVARRGRAKGS